MKTLISIIVSCQVCCDLSAAAFQNLDFDEVRLPLGPAVVPVERALLGWNAYIGPIVQKEINYDAASLGTAGIDLQTVVPFRKYRVTFYSGGTLLPGSIPAGPFPPAFFRPAMSRRRPRRCSFKAALSPPSPISTTASRWTVCR